MVTASNKFKLIGPSGTERYNPSAVTLSCRLSPEISAVNMEIWWFKETDCVCVYKNRQVTEGRRYKGRVSLFTQELERGNVSLQLRNCRESDRGHYLCQVTDGDRTEEITVEMMYILRLRGGGTFSGPSALRERKWTEDERMKMEKSDSLLFVSRVVRPSSAVTVFIPELLEKCAEDETIDEYRFLCPHAGQFMCKVTKLMFKMEEEGEVLYRIVSWDSCPWDRLDQKEPAGPLYSINCHKGSIRKLHLPHCETRTDGVGLTVAHVTGGNVEIIQPLILTYTHVIIDIQGFSLFGLLRALIFKDYPIEAQVLLFYINLKGKHRKSKLHMHLLPGNVPIEEVKKHERNTYIATSATCDLTPGKEYWPFSKNSDHKITIQPEFKKFKRDYGPNYHPTFEVFFNTGVDEVTLGLLDENKKEVWSRLVLLTALPVVTEAASSKSDTTGADFMDQHREDLIQRVPSVMEIADCLKSKKMITDEMYNTMNVPSLTSQQQMRLLNSVLDSGGKAVKQEAYKIIRKKIPGLVDDLESGSSSA